MAKGKRDLKKQARWKRHVEAQDSSGETVRGYCRRRNLSEAQFYAWRRELRSRKERQTVGFVPVEVERRDDSLIEVKVGEDRAVLVRPGFDEETFQRVIKALEAKGC